MKFKLLIICILIATISFGQKVSKKEVKSFCKEFSSVILKGNIQNSLQYFDPEYKQTQLEFLDYDTERFIKEFLNGEVLNSNSKSKYLSPVISDIEIIKAKKIRKDSEGNYEVHFLIKQKDGIKMLMYTSVIIKSGKMYFYGAVG